MDENVNGERVDSKCIYWKQEGIREYCKLEHRPCSCMALFEQCDFGYDGSEDIEEN